MHISLITRSLKKAAVSFVIAGFLAGCTTAAQRQYETIRIGNQAVAEQATAFF